MKYYPMHMHLHSIHDLGASMESHMYNARLFGMKYIRFTDHDTRAGSKNKINSFDFSRGEVSYENEQGYNVGFEPVGEAALEVHDGRLTVTGEERFGATLVTSGKRHTRAMPAEVTVKLGLKTGNSTILRTIIDIPLSQRPPEHKYAHIYYVIGEPLPETPELVAVINLDPREDGIYTLSVSRDAEAHPEIGGLDNAFGGVTVIAEGVGSFSLDLIEIESLYNCNDLILRQREVAAKIGEKYGITPFVTTEISGAGQHKNCFSSFVPVLDYSHGKITEAEAVAHVKSHGGIFAYNHPLERSKYKRVPFTREELDEIVRTESEELIANRVLGASLTEVGFTRGRGLFTIADYLKLWDNISSAGIFITGYGDSDSHKSHTAWFSGNNFASWIGVDDTLAHPISEEIFNAAMVAGRVYMGDPVILTGDVSFTCLGKEMGSVIEYGDGEELTLNIRLERLPEGTTVRIIRTGNVDVTEAASGIYARDYSILPTANVEFVRIEAYDENDRCFMLTNPIYFAKRGCGIEIPEARLARREE